MNYRKLALVLEGLGHHFDHLGNESSSVVVAGQQALDGAAGGILALGAGLYFATVLSKTPLPPLFRLLCALCVILRLLMLLADSYFDITVQMNASHKLALHLACLGGMMMTVCDVRALLGKPRPILFPFSLATAVLLTGGYALPNLLDAYTGALGASDPLTTAPEAIALLAIALYSALRLIALARAPRSCPEAVEEISAEESAEKIPTEEIPTEEASTEETTDKPTPEQET